jgi:hypothetical protein
MVKVRVTWPDRRASLQMTRGRRRIRERVRQRAGLDRRQAGSFQQRVKPSMLEPRPPDSNRPEDR